MGVREKLKRLERAAAGQLASFELLDGSRYYYDPASPELFLHWCECMKAGSAHNWPAPPEVMHKLREAKDVERALEKVIGEATFYSITYDPEILITERRLEPRGLVSSRDPDTGEWHVRDPYEEHDIPDLSCQHQQSLEQP
jgi:hypothetical protein